MRRSARRTWGCCREHLALEEGEGVHPRNIIESSKKPDAYRNILDMDPGFVQKQVWNELHSTSLFDETCCI